MTVLKQNPRAVLPRIGDKLLSNVTLVLTERQAFHGLFLVFERCELLQLLIRVGAWQDENEGGSWSRVLERLSDVEDRRRQELLSHLLVDVLLDGLAEFVGAHRFQDQQFHERTPLSANVLLIRWIQVVCEDLTLEETLPAFFLLLELLDQRIEEVVSTRIQAKLVPDWIW